MKIKPPVASRMLFPKNLFEFGQVFNCEKTCMDYVTCLKYPDGFVCKYCGNGDGWKVDLKKKSFICTFCKRWNAILVDTVMEHCSKPLCTWFMGAYLMVTHTPGISALQFQRQVGLSRYETAFQMLHKIRAGMQAPGRTPLSGTVEVDETYIGGHRLGGKRGRGAEKTLVIGAVEVLRTPKGTVAGRCRLREIEHPSTSEIRSFLEENVKPGSKIKTDAWPAYRKAMRGYRHDVSAIDDPTRAAYLFPHIHRVFSNLKAWIIGTHHGVSEKHMQAYLNEYCFRFNRRKHPMEAFQTVLGLASHAEAPTYAELYAGEPSWSYPNPK